MTGIVKWFSAEKGYGFICADDGRDVFVHRDGIADESKLIIDGQHVQFEIVQGPKGPKAADVKVVQKSD